MLERRLTSRRSRFVGAGLEGGSVEDSEVKDGGGFRGGDGASEAKDWEGPLVSESVLGGRRSFQWQNIVAVDAVFVFQ